MQQVQTTQIIYFVTYEMQLFGTKTENPWFVVITCVGN